MALKSLDLHSLFLHFTDQTSTLLLDTFLVMNPVILQMGHILLQIPIQLHGYRQALFQRVAFLRPLCPRALLLFGYLRSGRQLSAWEEAGFFAYFGGKDFGGFGLVGGRELVVLLFTAALRVLYFGEHFSGIIASQVPSRLVKRW